MQKYKSLYRSAALYIVGLVVVLGVLPLGIYGFLLGNVPEIHAEIALKFLEESDGQVALVDVRLESSYQERHISGAISLPLAQVLELDSANDLPPALTGKTLLLVCDVGFLSIEATRKLDSMGVKAYHVRGGMQDWGRAWPKFEESLFTQYVMDGGVIQDPFRAMTPIEQAAAALALLWIKPTYMVLSGVVSYILLLSKSIDIRLLGWSLLVFLIGEIFCAINYILLKDNSYFAEYIHSYSMAVAFGLAAYALVEGLDERLINFSKADKKCAMLPVCGPCVKYQAVRCSVRRLAQLACFTLVILAFIPLLSPFSYTAYNTHIGGFNHYYLRPVVHQWFEARYCPLIAIALTSLALLIMQLNPRTTIHRSARLLFCIGAGFLGFAFFRVALGLIYAETLIWATFWEELTELVFIGSVIYLLWVFRETLLPNLKYPDAFKRAFQ